MKADGIISFLRRAERYCLNEYSSMAKQAADLIESQDALIESLTAELSASQRRESAAVWKLQSIDWVGSGAKGRIADAIGILTGRGVQAGEENE